VQTVGLTSAARLEWVEALGLYDAVLPYDAAGDLARGGGAGADDRREVAGGAGAVLVDFAGDAALLRRIHETLGYALVRSILVGFTHRRAPADEAPMPGPKPEFFFAPDEMVRRGRELGRRYAEAWPGFAPVVERALRIVRVEGGDELVRVYRELLEGRADPAAGHVVSL